MPNAESARRRAIWLADQFRLLTVWAANQQAPIQQLAVARVLNAIAFDLARSSDHNHGDRMLEGSLIGMACTFRALAQRPNWSPCSAAELNEFRESIMGQVLCARVIALRLDKAAAKTHGGAA